MICEMDHTKKLMDSVVFKLSKRPLNDITES